MEPKRNPAPGAAARPDKGSAEISAVPVADPFGAVKDPSMPFLAKALDPSGMEGRLREALGEWGLRLTGIRVVRHKPGKRCLVEYGIERGGSERSAVIGKVRARGMDARSHAVQRGLREAGFDDENRFAVPRPLGKMPDLHMWLQKKEPGVTATETLAGPGGEKLARRIAEFSHELHARGVEPRRPPHTMDDELRILHERLSLVSDETPEWRRRIARILSACDELGASLPGPRPTPIHRDFYADQVLVDGEKLRLLDLDLYCEGDPGLDIGNFVAHMTEYALRELHSPDALKDREEALVDRYVELSGEEARPAIRAYETLSLVRHIHISTRIPERGNFTAEILALCEDRVAS